MLTIFAFALLISCWATANAANSVVYEIDFNSKPSYIPNNTVILTFDDGPDPTNTGLVLDVLKQRGVKATFFINSNFMFGSVDSSPALQNMIKRIISEGHELGDHSVSHPHMASMGAAQVEQEVVGVQQSVDKIFGAGVHKLTLYRAPYGEPYINHGSGFSTVSPIVAKYAVNVGWALASNDYDSGCDVNCIVNNVKTAIKTPGAGSWGVILNHCVYAKTAQALTTLLDYFKTNGFNLMTVEQAVQAKYGKSSSQLIYG